MCRMVLNITKILQGTPTDIQILHIKHRLNITKILQGTPTNMRTEVFRMKLNITKILQGTPTFFNMIAVLI